MLDPMLTLWEQGLSGWITFCVEELRIISSAALTGLALILTVYTLEMLELAANQV